LRWSPVCLLFVLLFMVFMLAVDYSGGSIFIGLGIIRNSIFSASASSFSIDTSFVA
jgi:hypothetical protein